MKRIFLSLVVMSCGIFAASLVADRASGQGGKPTEIPENYGPEPSGKVERFELIPGEISENGIGKTLYRLDKFTGKVWEMVVFQINDKGQKVTLKWWQMLEESGGLQHQLVRAKAAEAAAQGGRISPGRD